MTFPHRVAGLVLVLLVPACGSTVDTSASTIPELTPESIETTTIAPTTTSEPEPPTTHPTTTVAPTDVWLEDAPPVVRVAYYPEWPTPIQFGQEDGSFARAVGVPIEWIPLDSGGDMAEMMESGFVDIAYSQGSTSFANFANHGADLKIVGIATSYPEADLCIVQGVLGVTKANASDTLNGAVIATPFGTTSHFNLLSMLEHLGVNLGAVTFVQSQGGSTTVSHFETGDIDVGCAFGPHMQAMIDAGGHPLMTADEIEAIDLRTYDVVSIPATFGEQYPKVVSSFLRSTEQFNLEWATDQNNRNPVIANAARMQTVGDFLDGEQWLTFPTIEEQLSVDWLGGAVALGLQTQLEVFARTGHIDGVNAEIESVIDTSFLEDAARPAPTRSASTDERLDGDLGLEVAMTSPACDGQSVVVVGSAGDIANYADDVSALLFANPGSDYLQVSSTGCSSLGSDIIDGTDMYTVFYGPFADVSETCGLVSSLAPGAYVKTLDNVSDPAFRIIPAC